MHTKRTWITATGSALCALALTLFAADVHARLETVELRRNRQAKAEERWTSPSRVTINVHYRVPVIEALGYLAAFYPDNQKLITISEQLRPVAEQVQQLSGGSFSGRAFPAEVAEQCTQLRQQLFTAVSNVYGAEVSQQVDDYIKAKYQNLTTGLFSTIEE